MKNPKPKPEQPQPRAEPPAVPKPRQKSTLAEVRRRIYEVLTMRLGGAEFHDLRAHADAPERAWNVSNSQLRVGARTPQAA